MAATKPDFSHLCLQEPSNTSRWQSYMEPHATILEKFLWEHGDCEKSWGTCLVCDVEFPANLQSHLWGKAHMKKLLERLQWREPQSPEHCEQFTQYWRLRPGGAAPAYHFNHVTGFQGLGELPGGGGGGAAGSRAPGPAPAPCSYGTGPPPTARPFPGAAAAPAPGGPAVSGEIFPHKLGYAEALETKEGWRQHMEESSNRLQAYLHEATGKWDFLCKVCDNLTMDRGAAVHLPCEKHWVELWKKMKNNPLPSPEEAVDVRKPWYQMFQIPAGKVLYNHLTGGFRMEGGPEAPAGQPASSSSSPGPAPPPQVPAARPPPTASMPCAAGAGPLAFAHSQNYMQAFSDGGLWRKFMDTPSKFLEDHLAAATGRWDHTCSVCDKAMTRGAQDHFMSKNHWKELYNKLVQLNPKDPTPPQHIAEEMEGRPWVQYFETPAGVYAFNMLTGGQQLLGAAGAGPGAPVPGPTAQPSAASYQPAPPASAPAPAANGLGGPCGCGTRPPAAQDFRLSAGQMLLREGVNYRQALEDKAAWNKFMAQPTKQFEELIYRVNPYFGEQCPVCDANMNGIQDHLLGAKHHKSMWKKLNGVPPANEVSDWTKPWVWRVRMSGGVYLYNHVTGEQGFEEQILSGAGPQAVPQSPAASQAGSSMPDLSDSRGLHRMGQGAGPSASPVFGAPPRPGPPVGSPGPAATNGSAVEAFHWKCVASAAAAALAAALDRDQASAWGAAPSHRCTVCEEAMLDVREHLCSEGHRQQLLGKMAVLCEKWGYNYDEQLIRRGGPWVQEFEGVTFNHLTLEVGRK